MTRWRLPSVAVVGSCLVVLACVLSSTMALGTPTRTTAPISQGHRYDRAVQAAAENAWAVAVRSGADGRGLAGGGSDGSRLAAEGEQLTGTALARQLGREGEAAIPGAGNTIRIDLPNGGYRIPDILDESSGVLGEVKNVGRLSYTQQLRDYTAYAQENGMQFDLYVRGTTSLSGPLQGAIDNGLINLWRLLPG